MATQLGTGPTLPMQPGADAFEPWQPTKAEPWDLQRVWHLHRRAGFGATWSELQRDLHDGPERSVDRFVAGKARTEFVPDDFSSIADAIGSSTRDSLGRLKAWWVFRMLFSPDPLGEKLTLMWHNHFATSAEKVQNVARMRQQNLVFRNNCRAPFLELLKPVIQDPAMLVWLDAAANRSSHPNENLSRELLELFTLGEGHYSEGDVKEAARCLTGLRVVRGKVRFTPEHHDGGSKTVLEKTARFDCEQLLEFLCTRRETANRLAWRLGSTFFGEGVLTQAYLTKLAESLHNDELHIGRAVERILRSRLFYSQANLRTQIASPCCFAISLIRSLEMVTPPPDTNRLAWRIDGMGQRLFEPPNVFGWQGGRAWINTRSLVARKRFAIDALSGFHSNAPGRSESPFIAAELARRHQITEENTTAFFNQLITGRTELAGIPDARSLDSGRFVTHQLTAAEAQLQ